MHYPKLLLAALALFFGSCRAATPVLNDASPPESLIYFVVMKMSTPADGSPNELTLLSKQVTSGKLKSGKNQVSASRNYLKAIVYSNNMPADSLIIDHPLYKNIEYVGPKNSLTRKDVTVNEAEFFFRFQNAGKATEIKLFEKLENGPARFVTTVKL